MKYLTNATGLRTHSLASSTSPQPPARMRDHTATRPPLEPAVDVGASSLPTVGDETMRGASAGAPPPSAPDAGLTTDERRQLAVRTLADALLLGIVGDALLRVSSWGANLTLWSIGIIAAVLTLARRRHETLPAATWIAAPAAALGLMFVWRDSAELAVYNAVALAATLALLAIS